MEIKKFGNELKVGDKVKIFKIGFREPAVIDVSERIDGDYCVGEVIEINKDISIDKCAYRVKILYSEEFLCNKWLIRSDFLERLNG